MAKGRKTGGRNYTPGTSGNPGGLSKLPKDIREIKQLTEREFTLLMVKYMDTPVKKLKLHYQAMELPGKDLMIISVIYMAVKFGDYKRVEFLLNRLIGKVKDQVDHTVNLTQTQTHEAANSPLHFAGLKFQNAIKKDPMMRNGIPQEVTHGAKSETSGPSIKQDERSDAEWNELLEGVGAQRETQGDPRSETRATGEDQYGDLDGGSDTESDLDG